jgi:hypothetical protein
MTSPYLSKFFMCYGNALNSPIQIGVFAKNEKEALQDAIKLHPNASQWKVVEQKVSKAQIRSRKKDKVTGLSKMGTTPRK